MNKKSLVTLCSILITVAALPSASYSAPQDPPDPSLSKQFATVDPPGLARSDRSLQTIKNIAASSEFEDVVGNARIDYGARKFAIQVRKTDLDSAKVALLRRQISQAQSEFEVTYIPVANTRKDLLSLFSQYISSPQSWAAGLEGAVGGGPVYDGNYLDLTVATDYPDAWRAAYSRVADDRIKLTIVPAVKSSPKTAESRDNE